MDTSRSGFTEIRILASGYKDAGDALAREQNSQFHNDALVYPMLFCYRQYLELSIKALTVLVNRAQESEEGFPRSHNLKKLWSPIRDPLFNEIEQSEKEAFEIVEGIIRQFHEIDPRSHGFRYPSKVKQFNFEPSHTTEVMNRVATFIESLGDFLENSIRNRDG